MDFFYTVKLTMLCTRSMDSTPIFRTGYPYMLIISHPSPLDSTPYHHHSNSWV